MSLGSGHENSKLWSDIFMDNVNDNMKKLTDAFESMDSGNDHMIKLFDSFGHW